MRDFLLIFDLDGTLADSRRDIYFSFAHAMEELGFDPPSEAEFRPLIGKTLKRSFEVFLPGGAATAQRIEAGIAAYRRHYWEHCFDHTRPYEGVDEILAELAASGRFRLAVATTKQTILARRVIEGMGLAPYFDYIQGTDDFPAKPAPYLLYRVLEATGLPSERALMVGDTDSDVLAGKAAGTLTCAVTYGAWQREALEALEPDFLIDRFPEIAPIAHELADRPAAGAAG